MYCVCEKQEKKKKKKTPDVTQVININRKTDWFVSLRCYYVNQINSNATGIFHKPFRIDSQFIIFKIFIGNSDCFVAEERSVEFSTHMCNGHQYVCKRKVKSKVYRNLFLTHIYPNEHRLQAAHYHTRTMVAVAAGSV